MSRKLHTLEEYADGIRNGDRVMLGRAITLVESRRAEHQELARRLVNKLLAEKAVPDNSLRIGITGSPGVGKSSLIETLGMSMIEQGERVAVLAIDPSSKISKGSILGDKTRMERLSASKDAFIRPSAAGQSLGGVARKTRETILLVEAAGYHRVMVETVGVGQSETAVHSMTDLFLLLLLPGAGDDLQGIKRGIVEMADILAVNKADGDRIKLANTARAHYLNATHLLPAKQSDWAPRVLTCSATEGTGIPELLETVMEYRKHVSSTGFFAEKRRSQAAWWFKETMLEGLKDRFYNHPEVKDTIKRLEPDVLEQKISPIAAAEEVLSHFWKDL